MTPNMDERLTALRESVELLTHDVREMQAHMLRMDIRERKARRAIMGGILEYMRLLDEADGEESAE